MKDPLSREEWQEAVDAAHVLLAIDAARAYGLVKGGREVDAERCQEILEAGERLGVTPSPTAVRDLLQRTG